jgi:hypothetical protein
VSATALRAAAMAGRGLFIVTPLGWQVRHRLWESLVLAGAGPDQRIHLPDWPRLDTALRRRAGHPGRDRCALRFEAAWARHFPGGRAEAWLLPAGSFDRAAAVKGRLRPALGSLQVALGLPGRPWGHLHPFHLADREQAAAEALRLAAALAPHGR